MLTRAFGHTLDLAMDISEPIPLENGDGILLCSDGLSGFVGADEIKAVIAQNPDPSACVQQLVKLALASGSDDNITVQYLKVEASVRILSPPAKKRETMLEDLAIAPPAASAALSKNKLYLRHIAAAALFGFLVTGGGIELYRQTVLRSAHSPAAQPARSTQDDVNALNRIARATIAKSEDVEKGVQNAPLAHRERVQGELSDLRKKRQSLQIDLNKLMNLPGKAEIADTEARVRKEISELREIIGHVEKAWGALVTGPRAGQRPNTSNERITSAQKTQTTETKGRKKESSK